MDLFSDTCWFADVSLDWIDCPYQSDVIDLFDKKDDTQGDESDQLEDDLGEKWRYKMVWILMMTKMMNEFLFKVITVALWYSVLE